MALRVHYRNAGDANDTMTVREEALAGEEYLVAPVTAARSMELAGGYVPAEELEASVEAWPGTPLVLGHPTDAWDNHVSARTPSQHDQRTIGRFYNVAYDAAEQALVGELWVSQDAMGRLVEGDDEDVAAAAQAVHDRLTKPEEELEVSTAYRGEQGPPGMYDGAYREQVVVNLSPDHLALLAFNKGRCSRADGCGVPAETALAANCDGGDTADDERRATASLWPQKRRGNGLTQLAEDFPQACKISGSPVVASNNADTEDTGGNAGQPASTGTLREYLANHVDEGEQP